MNFNKFIYNNQTKNHMFVLLSKEWNTAKNAFINRNLIAIYNVDG